MPRRVVAILVAVVLGLVGAGLVFLYAKGADRRAVESQQPKTVFVVKQVVPAGTTLKDAQRGGLIEAAEVASKAVPAGVLTAVGPDNSGLVAVTDIAPGQYAFEAAFGTQRVGQKAIVVPTGKIAVSVSLEDPNRVGAFVTPGSKITIYDTYKIQKVGTDEATKQFNELNVKSTSVLLRGVEVIGIGASSLTSPAPATDAKGGAIASAQQPAQIQTYLVTLAVTPEESIRLVHAIQHSDQVQNNPAKHIYFGLEGPDLTVDPKLTANDLTLHGQ
jgi:pilus assembly protein CpaB